MEQTEVNNLPNFGSLSPDLYSKVMASIQDVKGQPVILDKDVAILYGVGTRIVNQAVKRNQERFPKTIVSNFQRMMSRT